MRSVMRLCYAMLEEPAGKGHAGPMPGNASRGEYKNAEAEE